MRWETAVSGGIRCINDALSASCLHCFRTLQAWLWSGMWSQIRSHRIAIRPPSVGALAGHVNRYISKPKTKSSDRTVILPPAVLSVLKELKARTDSEWMLPSPVLEGSPVDPQSVYRKMKKVLARAECKDIRFHDLRHPYVKYTTRETQLNKNLKLPLWRA